MRRAELAWKRKSRGVDPGSKEISDVSASSARWGNAEREKGFHRFGLATDSRDEIEGVTTESTLKLQSREKNTLNEYIFFRYGAVPAKMGGVVCHDKGW